MIHVTKYCMYVSFITLAGVLCLTYTHNAPAMPQGAQRPRAIAYISVHAQGKVHIYQHLRASAYIIYIRQSTPAGVIPNILPALITKIFYYIRWLSSYLQVLADF